MSTPPPLSPADRLAVALGTAPPPAAPPQDGEGPAPEADPAPEVAPSDT